jgi:N-acetylglucosamine-6-phosphate deacetylase
VTFAAASHVVTPTGILSPGWVEVESGVITAVGQGPAPEPVPVHQGWLVPGFVDMHCHGGGGASFMAADPESVATVVATHRLHGTTSIIASLVSATPDLLLAQVEALAGQCDAGVIRGIHLEGPWICERYRGAHDPLALRPPDLDELDALLAAGNGHIRMITIAPELPGALPAIEAASASGVVVAVGHTDADYEQVAAAIDAGATVATHLFNAMRPLGQRDPGPVAALTQDPRVTVELIVDGVHVAEPVVALGRRAAEGRVALVTDAMSAAGGVDGDYMLGSLAVSVVDGVARLVEGGAIAGSTLTLDHAVRRFVRECGATVPQAVAAAATTPADLMGLSDVGAIEPGRRADLVALDPDLTLLGVTLG